MTNPDAKTPPKAKSIKSEVPLLKLIVILKLKDQTDE